MQNEIFPIVDEKGNVVGSASRKECHSGSFLLHPVVHLHVFDEKWRLFLQHRSPLKDIQPDKWDTSVGGHVDFGEKIEDALRRETKEELGLSIKSAKHLYTYIFRSDREAELVNTFSTICNPSDIVIDRTEIDEGRFFAIEEIKPLIGKDFFTPNFELEFEKLMEVLRCQ